jgi:hypothetical protein
MNFLILICLAFFGLTTSGLVNAEDNWYESVPLVGAAKDGSVVGYAIYGDEAKALFEHLDVKAQKRAGSLVKDGKNMSCDQILQNNKIEHHCYIYLKMNKNGLLTGVAGKASTK